MGLTLITGRANAGKTGLLHDALIAAAPHSQPVLLLPQLPDADRAAREFAGRGVLGIRAMVLDDWIEQLWRLHGDGRRFVGPTARTSVMSAAMREVDLVALASSAKSSGFPSLFADLITRVVLPLKPGSDPVEAELVRLIKGYRRTLDRLGLVEASDATLMLASDPPHLSGPVALNRFTDLSLPQEALLTALARAGEVSIALTWEAGSASTEALDPLVGRLLDGGAAHAAVAAEAWTDPGLASLERALFEEVPPQQVPASLRLGVASGDEAECALVARLARGVIASGTDPGQVAIAFRDVSRRAGLLAAALSAEGVPVEMDVSFEFAKTSYGAAFLALADACGGRGSTRERLLAFLHSPYAGAPSQAVDDLDRSWRRSRTPDSDMVSSAIREVPEAAGMLRTARALAARTVDRDSAPEWKEMADGLLQSATRRRGLGGLVGETDAAAHRAVLRAVGEFVDVATPAGESELTRSLRTVRVSTGRGEVEGRVLVTEAHRLRGRRFDTLILGGLTADEFSSERREPLAGHLATRLGQPPGVDARLAERLLFYTMVSRARRELVLVRQSANERGEAVRPSAFWDESLDVYRTPHESAEGELPAAIAVERLMSADIEACAPALLPGRRELRAEAVTHAAVPPTRGRLTSDESLEALARRDEFSISEIETYIGCPYRWFYQRALRPREIDAEFDTAERGSRAHEILRTFYSRWTEDGRGRIGPEGLDDALEALGHAVGEVEAGVRRVRTRGLAEELSAAKARAWAANVVRDDPWFLPAFTPARHELRFGEDADVPVRLWGIGLKGSIDRVDVSAGGLVIVDYKSAKESPGVSLFRRHGLVQIPVYAAVASDLLGLPVRGGFYRSLKSLACRGFWDASEIDLGSRGRPSDGTDAEGIATVIEDAGEMVCAAVDGIRRGRIEPDPLRRESCGYCDAKLVCGGVR